jgi:ATP-dependent protease ClpP protease subunit
VTTYRFWGSTDPRGRTKIPLLASVPAVDTDAWTVQVYEPIDSWGGIWGISASEFAEALRGVPDAAALTMRINSPGGEVTEAVAIANLLRERSGALDVRVDGWAASAASYLAVQGHTVTMGVDSLMMIHNPWGVTIGDAPDHDKTADLLRSMGGSLARAYQSKAGGELSTWLAAMAEETWYTAAEAVSAGLADGILGEESTAEDLPLAAATQGWSLTGLARGRGPAPDTTPPPAPVPAPEPPAAVAGFNPDRFRADLINALKGA